MLITILFNLLLLHGASIVGVHATAKALNYKVDDDYTWVPFLGLVGNFYLMGAMLGNANQGVLKALTSRSHDTSARKMLDVQSKDKFYGYSYNDLENYTKKFFKILDALDINYSIPYINNDQHKEYYNHINLFVMIYNSKCSATEKTWFSPYSNEPKPKSVSDGLRTILGLLCYQELPQKSVPVLMYMIDTLAVVYNDTDAEIISDEVEEKMLSTLQEYYNTLKLIFDAEALIKQKVIEDKMEFHKEIALPRIEKVQSLLVDIQNDYDEQLKKHGLDLKKV